MRHEIDERSSSGPLSSPSVPAMRMGSSATETSTPLHRVSESNENSVLIPRQLSNSDYPHRCECCPRDCNCDRLQNISPEPSVVSPPSTPSPVTQQSVAHFGSSIHLERRTSNIGLPRRRHMSPVSRNSDANGRRGRTDSISHSRTKPGASIVDSQGTTYRIGQQIGRGGVGVVYQALNTETADWVAVKCVALDTLDNESLASIRSEIDLLKKLNHVNIVQYIDTIQTEFHLHILLEMMESSLSAMCKKFGNFPESLTAIYMTQVLEGLCYLHDQGVIHRDIKGANILTAKNGLLKLADFGVAKKLTDAASINEETDAVGTPYWMAPEMIEMTGLTTACDIWSVGIMIIELITGNPPYYDLPPFQALYKIVQDDHPPLPDNASAPLKDFLMLCCRKEAVMRKSASELLEHPWLLNHKAHLKVAGRDALSMPEDKIHGSSRQVVLKSVRTWANNMRNIDPQRRLSLKDPSEMQDINTLADKLYHDLDKVILSPTETVPAERSQEDSKETETAVERLAFNSNDDDLDWDMELSAEALGGKLTETGATQSAFSEHLGTGYVNGNFEGSSAQQQQQQQHTQAAANVVSLSNTRTSELSSSASAVSSVLSHPTPACKFLNVSLDADALADWGEEDAYDNPTPLSVNCQGPHHGRTDGAVDLFCYMESDEDKDSDVWEFFQTNSNNTKFSFPSPNIARGSASGNSNCSLVGEKGPGSSFAELLHEKIVQRQASQTLQASELNDELGIEFESDQENNSGEASGASVDALMKVGKEIYEQLSIADACISIKPSPKVMMIVNECSTKLACTPEARFYVLSSNNGGVVLLNLLRRSFTDVRRSVIALINNIVNENARDLEHLALLGITPDIIAQVDSKDVGLQLEVAKFVHAMCTASTRTLEMFVGAGGMKALVDLLDGLPDEKDPAARAMMKVAVDGILDVFQILQARRNDICRLFLNLGLLPRILRIFKTVLNGAIATIGDDSVEHTDVLDDGMEWSVRTLERIAHILMTFSKSDRIVKEGLVGADCGLSTIMETLPLMYPRFAKCKRAANLTTTLLTVLKNISMETTTLWCLMDSKRVDLLVRMLERTGYPCDHDVESQVLQCMFYLCRLSRKRQEIAAMAGLIPYLIRCISEGQNLRQFALSIFCELPNSTALVRNLLWQHNGIDFYIEIIQSGQLNWQAWAFHSIAAWTLNDTERVEKKLVVPHALTCIVSLFRQKPVFETVVGELDDMMQRSTLLVKALGEIKEFVEVIAANLYYPNAIVVKSLLNMLYLVFGNHSAPHELIREFNLYPSVYKLAENNIQVLVAELASQLLRVFIGITKDDANNKKKN